MGLLRITVWMFQIGLCVLGGAGAAAQGYPSKPVRIVTSGIGGGNDFVARVIAEGISEPLGQRVIVDNRNGNIPGELVSAAPPDGYTTLVASFTFWIGPMLQSTPYDPIKDFSPVTVTGTTPLFLVVHPSLPVKSVKELIALAKAKPGALNYASGPNGAATHLAGELFKSMTGTDIVRISYKSGGSISTDLISGQVQLMFGPAVTVMSHIKTGKLRALGVTSPAPSVLLPDLAPVAASGISGYELVLTYGLFAPAKTPEAIIGRINQEVAKFLTKAAAKKRLLSNGIEAVSSSSEQLGATVKSEMARMAKVIESAGIQDK